MTTVFMWNVQFFSNNKISMVNSQWRDLVDVNGNVVDGTFDTLMNLEYITSNIELANPQIFVLIENLSARGVMGSLAGGNGAIGSRLLLDRIRGATLNQNWMLVPPLKLVDEVQTQRDEVGLFRLIREGAYTECISVFYRNDVLAFVGPYVWPATDNNDNPAKIAQRNTGQPTQAYPAVWEGTYPAGNFFAGQFEFFRNPVARTGRLLFPDVGARRPFLTQFRERDAPGRLITLASVHYPPNPAPAGGAFQTTLDFFSQPNWPVAADEVILVGGDVNLDYLTDKPLNRDRLYGCARREGFRLALDRQNTNAHTIIKRPKNASPTDYTRAVGLDNIAYRSGPPIVPRIDVFDRVNGTQPSLMFTPMAQIMGLPTQAQRNTTFRLQQNYSYMGPVPGVSDHLPILFQF
jgi:hypothetical protein